MSDDRAQGGKWKPGKSGNPGGSPKGLVAEIRARFAADAIPMLEVFRDLALGRTPLGYEGAEIKTSDRIKAGAEVLDRTLGKAPQTIDGNLDLGASPEQLALLAALQMTPHERRKKLAEIDAEDARAIEAGPPPDADD